MSAFGHDNAIDMELVDEYYDMLDCVYGSLEDPPPVRFYRTTLDEDDVERCELDNINFLNGNPVTHDDIGLEAYMICDGHHRALAAIRRGLRWIRGVEE
jgi:hypothetical protein